MRRFKTKKEAEAYRKTLRKPKIHQTVRLPRYNSDLGQWSIIPGTGDSIQKDPYLIPNFQSSAPNTGNKIGTIGTIGGGVTGGGGASGGYTPPITPGDPIGPGGGGLIPEDDGSGGTIGPINPPQPPPSGTPGSGTMPGGTVTGPVTGTGPNQPGLPSEQFGPENNTEASEIDTAGELRDTIDDNTSDLQQFLEDNAAWIGVGALAGGALVWDGLIRDEDESLVRRVFNSSRTKAASVFPEYENMFEAEVRDDMLELLKRDFARQGPLWNAYQRDELNLTLDRKNWSAFNRPYTERNFPPKKWKGFARLDKEIEAYLYNKDGEVLSKVEFQRLIANNTFVNPESFKRGRMRGFTVINAKGEKVTYNIAKPDQYVDVLGNTAKGAYDNVDFETEEEKDPESAVVKARAERERLERQLKELNRSITRTSADSGLSPLEIIERENERAERQRKADEAQKEARRKREEKQQEDRLKKEAEERLKLENLVQSSGDLVADNQVSKERYELDKQWVTRFVNSGLGGQIPSDAIKSWEYKFNAGGSVLVINYTDDFAESRGYPAGFQTEKWSRKRLISLNAIPQQYGPGFTPLWFTTTGRASSQTPNWASRGKIPTAKFARRKSSAQRKYHRKIRGQKFLGSSNAVSKSKAVSSAINIRRMGRNARVIPGAGGWRVYVGGNRRR